MALMYTRDVKAKYAVKVSYAFEMRALVDCGVTNGCGGGTNGCGDTNTTATAMVVVT